MTNNKITYGLILLLAAIFQNCASPEKVVYFQDIENLKAQTALVNYEPQLQVGDILTINVSAIDAEAAVPFNLYETPPTVGVMSSNAKPLTYIVDASGVIQFPVIGSVQVGGKTIKENTAYLTNLLKDYIKKPIVNIRLTNFRVTVLGEVKKPGTFQVANERISVVEALGLAGDLTIHGKRKEIQLIREQNGERKFVTLDLTSKKIFESPYFYLAQNDVIYVTPNKTKVNSSAVGTNTGVIISSISILLSLISILLK
ncbi:polysaccharide export outer membrane protein [Lutibacter oricola]|uniref:Polysaccharide export outer membrane protein n=1 Tax=Lutibacter oricola TaxID=762486 RepID=A0A1H3FR69_9FLAO|nr:polysaccharide biosynthesis/export family protein [Lutibacter oricola]SDX93355.1 polysaccharide export outer membrane protein [Lutibacter oricola]